MKERLLFHLRLGGSSSPRLARRKSLIGAERASIWSSPSLLHDEGSGAIPAEEETPLVCTCVHSSLSCAVAVGFKRGVVHVYHRQEGLDYYGRSRRDREEEKWKRSVLYPTRSLGGVAASPIESPASTLPPDITCVAIAPGGDKLAVGTSDGFVFVTQVSDECLSCAGLAASCRAEKQSLLACKAKVLNGRYVVRLLDMRILARRNLT